jgi:hypothetical protein
VWAPPFYTARGAGPPPTGSSAEKIR